MSAPDTALDPLSGPGFDALWTQQIEPQLLALEGERRAAMRRSILIWSAFAALILVEALLTGWITDGRSYLPSPYVLFFTVLAAVLAGFGPLNRVAVKVKARVLQTLCAPMGVTYQVNPPNPPAFKRLVELNLLPASLDRNFDGMLQGRRGDVDFMICETRISVRTGSHRQTSFQGQVFGLTFPRPFEGTTVLLREAGWKTRFECPKGLEKIGLEDPAFDDIWAAFGDDQVAARAVLTPSFMEQLVALEAAYAGKDIRCAFSQGELMIAVDGQPQFLLGSMLVSLDNRAKAEHVARDVGAAFRLIDVVAAAVR